MLSFLGKLKVHVTIGKFLFFILMMLSFESNAEDKWHMGLGYGANIAHIAGVAGFYDKVEDSGFSFYLTKNDNLEVTYKISYVDRKITEYGNAGKNSQSVLHADVIYNIANSKTGWFVDVEGGVIAPLDDMEVVEGFGGSQFTIGGQKDVGMKYGIGFGKTFSHRWTLRFVAGRIKADLLYVNGLERPEDRSYQGFNVIYTW